MLLIGFELRRIIGRSGSFFGVAGVALVVALLAAFLLDSDAQTASTWAGVIGTPMVFGATVVGALTGSYDTAQGTMRYLVLTGVPRAQLVALRLPALIVAIVLIALPAVVVGFFAMLSGPADASEIVHGLVPGLIDAIVWGVVAMSIGTLLRSNGAGIAVSLVLYLLSNVITAIVQSQVSQTVGDYLLPNVAAVVALLGDGGGGGEGGGFDSDLGFAPALVALVVWLVAIVGLAIVRAQRDEY